ncbi:MAG: hypothetical protein H0V29_07915 [Thermoleophilaceae bacterium]|nr:hypothetical protein [Thermoleophilaceae bacterium]
MQASQAVARSYADIISSPNIAELVAASVTLADPAPLPDDPVRPKPMLYLLLAGILGLV